MGGILSDVWQNVKSSAQSAASDLAADFAKESANVRNDTADAIARAGAQITIGTAAAVGAPGNKYQTVQTVLADWRIWLALVVAILVVVYFVSRKR